MPGVAGASGWVVAVVAVLFLLGWYLSFSASRLDRLHARVESSQAALDAQLVRRAAAALDAAQMLDPSTALLVADAAAEVMACGERGDFVVGQLATAGFEPVGSEPDGSEPDGSEPTGSVGREEAENQLSRALQVAFAEPEPDQPHELHPAAVFGGEKLSAALISGLMEACERVQLARRFHNDAVAQAQRVRRKRVIRWARLAGRAAMPQMFEIDDSLPPGLARRL